MFLYNTPLLGVLLLQICSPSLMTLLISHSLPTFLNLIKDSVVGENFYICVTRDIVCSCLFL